MGYESVVNFNDEFREADHGIRNPMTDIQQVRCSTSMCDHNLRYEMLILVILEYRFDPVRL